MFCFTKALKAFQVAPRQGALRRALGQRSADLLFTSSTVTAINGALGFRSASYMLTFQRLLFSITKGKGGKVRAPLEWDVGDEDFVVGDVRAGIRSNELTAYERSDFIGHLYPLIRPRADAGDILALIDTAAAHAVYTQMSGLVCGGRFVLTNERISMATIAFNAFVFSKPVFQGDLIQVNTRIISAGSSSIGVYVHVRRQAYDAPVLETVGESYVTMVVVNARTLQVTRGYVPAARLVRPSDKEHHQEYMELRKEAKMQIKLDPDRILTKEEVEHPENQKKKRKLKPAECICRMDRSFGVVDVNANKAIFGGEMLRFMEKCALHCGRVFARQARLFTLGMMDMTFEGPLFINDLARCKAQVVFVRRSTILVNVRVIALDANGEGRSTNRASFILVAIDSVGSPFEIETGIDLEGASQQELQQYWHGRRMMWASHLRRSKRTAKPVEEDKAL
ncbi:hypothetical protein ABL78_0117 [Leptomonas seymouri]|uniref:HotDog ACOT-type domain-containing protein n=1 Tax=Leptomonas seymouri TaxID=5684 RepID=A0A0N1I2C1_LEPSE|nr:hypothetical protein ABL78_0117 [Leptomonas seymouri]|eukprot:KPI90681.1 hypothetical protein ABL78_0117 [Leptomonas seymouri]